MKTSILALFVATIAVLSGSAQAQCRLRSHFNPSPIVNGGSYGYSAPMPSYSYPMQSYAARPAYSAMPSVAPRASGSISHVNRLTPALDRGTYLLNYAVHLNDGRILYTEFLPSGYSIAGSEIGGAARKVSAAVGSPGLVNVADPVSGQMIATIPQ